MNEYEALEHRIENLYERIHKVKDEDLKKSLEVILNSALNELDWVDDHLTGYEEKNA